MDSLSYVSVSAPVPPIVCPYDYFASSAPLFMAVANPSSDTETPSGRALGFVAVITRLSLLFIASVAAEGHQRSAIGLQSLPFSASRKAFRL